MSTKLFVGGLPWAMDNKRLKEVFAEFGEVTEAAVILDRETGRSRGFGFVTFATPEAAENALTLNGKDIDGRPLRIDRAAEKQRPARAGGGGARGPGAGPGAGREAGAGGGARREFSDDWGGGKDKDKGGGKPRGRRRGGRGGRGGGGEPGDGSSGGWGD